MHRFDVIALGRYAGELLQLAFTVAAMARPFWPKTLYLRGRPSSSHGIVALARDRPFAVRVDTHENRKRPPSP